MFYFNDKTFENQENQSFPLMKSNHNKVSAYQQRVNDVNASILKASRNVAEGLHQYSITNRQFFPIDITPGVFSESISNIVKSDEDHMLGFLNNSLDESRNLDIQELAKLAALEIISGQLRLLASVAIWGEEVPEYVVQSSGIASLEAVNQNQISNEE